MLRFAFANLLSRPGRTVLATLGLTIAIAGMVGLFAIAGGIDDMLEEGLGEIPGVVVQQPGAPIPLFSTLPADWGTEMANLQGVHVVNPEVWARVNLLDGETIFSPPRLLLGIDIVTRLQLTKGMYPQYIESGRFLEPTDIGKPHVVISRQISEDTGKQVGDHVDVNGHEMAIVGIYHSGALIVDMTMIADIGVVREMARIDPNTVSCFYLEPHAGVTTDDLTAQVQQHFVGREPSTWEPSGLATAFANPPTSLGEWVTTIGSMLANSAPGPEKKRQRQEPNNVTTSPDDGQPDVAETPSTSKSEMEAFAKPDLNLKPLNSALEVHSVADYGDRFNELSADLDLILGLLTGLGMMIAVFSILNTMLMSVTERTVEFGILRANGWSQSDVVRLITCESAILGLAGGVLGVLLGWVATQAINSIWSDRAHLYAGPMLLAASLAFSMCVGILGGLYPSVRAARMSPMQAIRRG